MTAHIQRPASAPGCRKPAAGPDHVAGQRIFRFIAFQPAEQSRERLGRRPAACRLWAAAFEFLPDLQKEGHTPPNPALPQGLDAAIPATEDASSAAGRSCAVPAPIWKEAAEAPSTKPPFCGHIGFLWVGSRISPLQWFSGAGCFFHSL